MKKTRSQETSDAPALSNPLRARKVASTEASSKPPRAPKITKSIASCSEFFVAPEMILLIRSIGALGRDWRGLPHKNVISKSSKALKALNAKIRENDDKLEKSSLSVRIGPMSSCLKSWNVALSKLVNLKTGELVAKLPSTEHIAKLALLTIASDIAKRHVADYSSIEDELDLSDKIKDSLKKIADRSQDVAYASATEAMNILSSVECKHPSPIEYGYFLRMFGVQGNVYGSESDEDDDDENRGDPEQYDEDI